MGDSCSTIGCHSILLPRINGHVLDSKTEYGSHEETAFPLFCKLELLTLWGHSVVQRLNCSHRSWSRDIRHVTFNDS